MNVPLVLGLSDQVQLALIALLPSLIAGYFGMKANSAVKQAKATAEVAAGHSISNAAKIDTVQLTVNGRMDALLEQITDLNKKLGEKVQEVENLKNAPIQLQTPVQVQIVPPEGGAAG